MTLRDAQHRLGAAQVALDTWERYHGTNASRYTPAEREEQNALLLAVLAGRDEVTRLSSEHTKPAE